MSLNETAIIKAKEFKKIFRRESKDNGEYFEIFKNYCPENNK
jgi:hypothetical protein